MALSDTTRAKLGTVDPQSEHPACVYLSELQGSMKFRTAEFERICINPASLGDGMQLGGFFVEVR